jgi:hypothetical protein
VSQESAPGAGDFDANILGFIDPFPTGLTAAGFYNYGGGGNPVSYGGALPVLTLNQSHLFLVQGSDGLSLFIVHDRPNVANGGGAAQMQFDLLNDLAAILVRDDPGDGYASVGGNLFTSNHNWVTPNTDGLAIGSLDGAFTMFAQFTASPTGLLTWHALSANGSTIDLALEDGRRVRLDIVAVPEPGTLLLCGLITAGVGGCALRRRRQAVAPW